MLAARVQNECFTLPANTALAPYLRVVLSSGYLAAAGAADREIGTLSSRILSTDTVGAVVPVTREATVSMVAASSFAQYAKLYGAASGKVDDSPNGNPVGIALQAAGGDGDVVEVMRVPFIEDASATVEAKTADYPVTYADAGKYFTNDGAAGTVVFSLPAAVPGLRYRFQVLAAQALRIDPNGTETIGVHTGVQAAAGKYVGNSTAGNFISIVCVKAGQWNVDAAAGTWTAEA